MRRSRRVNYLLRGCMKKIRTWQLCRTGTFGQDGATITKKDLEDIVDTFTPTRPVTIGHDGAHKDNFPKFGDVLAIDGIYDDASHPGEQVLVGEVLLHPALDALYDDGDGSGVYKGWSVTIPRRASDGKRYLHSLAITGAVPPKIPGLEQLMTESRYADGDKVEVINFSDRIDYEEARMTEEEKKKMEALEAENKKLKEATEKKKKEEADAAKAAADSEAKKSGEFADITKRCEQLEAENRKARIDGFIGKVSGKIPASLMPKVTALAGQFADRAECEFADGAETKKTSALDLFADVLDAGFKDAGNLTRQVFTPGSSDFSDAKDSNGKRVDWNALAAKI